MNEQNNNQFNNMMGGNFNNNGQSMSPQPENPTPVSPENLNPQMNMQSIPQQNMINPQINNGMINPQPMMNQGMQNPQMMNNNMMNQGIQNPQPMMNNQPIINNSVQNPNMQPTNSKGNNKKIFIIIGGVVLAIIAIVVLVLALTGNSKTLTCTMSETSFGVTMDMEATVKFKGDKAKSAIALITVDLGSMSDYKDTYLESLEDSYSGYEEDGVDVEITSDDSKIYVKISGENTNSDFIGSEAEKYEDVKKDLEESGFTCK